MSSSGNVSRAARPLLPALWILVSVLAAFPARAQEPAVPVVESVVVEADGQAGEQDLAEIIAIKKGDPYSLKKVDRSVQQIFQTGLFSDVRVLKTGDDRVELRFILTHRLTVRNVEFSGGKGLPLARIREAVESLKPGGFYSDESLSRSEAELRNVLKDEGFYEPSLAATVDKALGLSLADVRFRIEGWKRYAVAGIEFAGSLPAPENDIRKRMKTGPGAIYAPSRFREDLDRIKDYLNGLGYHRAEVDIAGEKFDPVSSRVTVTVGVNPREKVTLAILGADIPVSLIEPIWEEHIFEEWGLAEGEVRILAHLRKQGYLFASLKSRIERPENEIRVIYEVSPGSKLRIDRIEFEGLVSIEAARVRAELGIVEKMPFFALVDGERLFELPAAIEDFYRRNGFPGCRVTLNLKSRGKAATAVFYVEEGARRTIAGIRISGAALFPADQVRQATLSREGGPFFAPDIQRDLERIETFYLDRGVRGTKAVAEIREDPPGSFTVSIAITEGRPLNIGEIIITGNKATRRKTIIREVLLKPGDAASRALVLESKRRIEALGIFAEVRLDEAEVESGRENLVITVREGEVNYAGLGVGLETRTEPRSLALWENDIRLRGTAEYIRSNVFGAAAQLSLVTQFSLVEKRAVLAWEQPYFFGVPMRTVLNAWIEGEDRTSFGFDRRGVSLNVIKPVFPGFAVLGTLTYSRTKLTFLNIAENEVDRQLFPYSTTQASATLMWDRRNDTFNPTRGTFLSVVGEWAYPLFKTESDYLKAFIKFQHYYPILSRLNFSTTFRLGLGRGRIPIPERFFAGGSNSFRGERIDGLGPRDPESDMPIGGKAMFLVNLELAFPLLQGLDNLTGAVFYDLGQVFSQRKEISAFNLRGAVGWGLRYKTPLGPVRFDLGWNIDDPRSKGRPLAFITIGNLF